MDIFNIDTCQTEIKEGKIMEVFIKPIGSDEYIPVSEYQKTLRGPTITIDMSGLK